MEESRRTFLKQLAAGAAAAGVLAAPARARASGGSLQVWSCGGLAEAMVPAHKAYEAESGVDISHTGAFAGALGKSLMTGSGTTDVFAGRVLQLAKNLRKGGKMACFKPLCFTTFGIAVPKGNPKGIKELADLAKPGMRVAMAPLASPPGSGSVAGILKASNLAEAVMKNVLDKRASCVQREVEKVFNDNADAMIAERRITRIPRFADKLDYLQIPAELIPAGPLTFTVGIMTAARDRGLADAYVSWITSPKGQQFFVNAGFISAYSEEGATLIEKFGVHDA